MTEKPNPVHDIESEGGVIAHSPGAVRNRADGASLIQVEQLGRNALVLILFVLSISLLAVLFSGYAWTEAARAAERADAAQTKAGIAQLYATQVYTELNRLGYPVKSPAEFDHELHPEDE